MDEEDAADVDMGGLFGDDDGDYGDVAVQSYQGAGVKSKSLEKKSYGAALSAPVVAPSYEQLINFQSTEGFWPPEHHNSILAFFSNNEPLTLQI